MKYVKPNFDNEWMEALRYRVFEKMGKEGWLNVANKNYDITNFKKIEDVLYNVDLDYNALEDDKKKRFEDSFEKGKIEIPIVVKFSENNYDLLGGNTRLAGLVNKGINPKLWVVDMTQKVEMNEKWSEKYKDSIDCSNPKGFSQRAHCQGKKKDTTEAMGADAAGAFAPALGAPIIKRKINKIHNLKEDEDIEEAVTADASGSYDVPFPSKNRKNPLSIEGPESIKSSRAVKDKKFPKWGGPEGKFIKIKEKCKRFPYCNQGDINAIELLEIDGLKESIRLASKKYGIPYSEIEKIVLNEINKIFIQ